MMRCTITNLFLQPHKTFSTIPKHASSNYSPIVIVGGGPTGLLLSALLSKYNVPSTALERKSKNELMSHPQAHFINLRSLEILRHYTHPLYRRVLREMPNVEEWEAFRFGYSVLGRQFSKVVHPVHDNGGRSAVEMAGVHLSQNRFWGLLYDACLDNEVHLNAQVDDITSLREDDGDLFSIRYSSHGIQHNVNTKCIVGADGAHSFIRNRFSIPLQGKESMQHLINVHFRVHPSNLHEYLNKPENIAMLHFVYNEKNLGVYVCHDAQKGEWVCQIPFFPPLQSVPTEEQMKTTVLHGLLSGSCPTPEEYDKRVQNAKTSISILSMQPWTMSSLVASEYYLPFSSDRHVLLAGDAAHAFPPAGGFGMNTGLQDAHNLAWRLALWYHNPHKTFTFHAYERERKPIARNNAALSVQNYRRTVKVVNILLGANNFLDMSYLSQKMVDVFQLPALPLELRRDVFCGMVDLAMKPLQMLGYPAGSNILADAMIHRVHALLSRGEGLPLIFPHYELGFHYSGKSKNQQDDDGPKGTYTPKPYIPKLEIGHRLPHCKLTLPHMQRRTAIQKFHDIHPNLILDDEDNSISLADIAHQLRPDERSPPSFALIVYHPNTVNEERIKSYFVILQRILKKIQGNTQIIIDLVHIVPPTSQQNSLLSLSQNNQQRFLSLVDEHAMFDTLVQKYCDPKSMIIMVLVQPDGHIANIAHMDDEEIMSGEEEKRCYHEILDGLGNCI